MKSGISSLELKIRILKQLKKRQQRIIENLDSKFSNKQLIWPHDSSDNKRKKISSSEICSF